MSAFLFGPANIGTVFLKTFSFFLFYLKHFISLFLSFKNVRLVVFLWFLLVLRVWIVLFYYYILRALQLVKKIQTFVSPLDLPNGRKWNKETKKKKKKNTSKQALHTNMHPIMLQTRPFSNRRTWLLSCRLLQRARFAWCWF